MDNTLETDIDTAYRAIDRIHISDGVRSFIQLVFVPIYIISAILGLTLGVMLGSIVGYALSVLDSGLLGDFIKRIESGIMLLSIIFILDKTHKGINKIDPLFFIRLRLKEFFDNYKMILQKDEYTVYAILKESQSIYRYQKIILFLGKMPFIFTKGSYQKILEIITLSNKLIVMMLEYLKIRLSHKLREEVNVIEDGQRDLENINTVGGLEQVSEAQKLRLDEQIKQFEELQRVLVKV